MFVRFAAASAIASMLIALAALVVLVTPEVNLQRTYPLALVWCTAPAVWGLWAMLAPKFWVPQRLAWWGAILGVIAGVLAAFVLNLPSRVIGEAVPPLRRGVAVVFLVLLYFLIWKLVAVAYRSLSARSAE